MCELVYFLFVYCWFGGYFYYVFFRDYLEYYGGLEGGGFCL